MSYTPDEFKEFINNQTVQGVICSCFVRLQFQVDTFEPVVVLSYQPEHIGQYKVRSKSKEGFTSISNVIFKTSPDSPTLVANQTRSIKEKKPASILIDTVDYGT